MSATRAWHDLVQSAGFPVLREASEVFERFAADVGSHCELTQGPDSGTVGFLCRGDTAQLTERAQGLMRAWAVPDGFADHHRALAAWFEHQRAFIKVEWNRGPANAITPSISCYFRRRPAVVDVCSRLHARGVPRSVLAVVADVARVLEKETDHFVAATAGDGREEVKHKLYFSQYVTVDSYATVLRRVLSLIELFEVDRAAAALLAQCHGLLAPPGEASTILISIAFTNRGLLPSIKLDYARILPPVGALLVAAGKRMEARDEMARLAGSRVSRRCPISGCVSIPAASPPSSITQTARAAPRRIRRSRR